MKDLLQHLAAVILNPIVLFAAALLGIIIGVTLLLDAPAFIKRQVRAEQLAPVSAEALLDSSPGREVLLEGRISANNPTLYRNFVAYVREEYRDEFFDGDTTQRWVEVERATPPLLITVAGGDVRLANDDYTFDTTAVTIEEVAPTVTRGAVQARGYMANNPVVAIGHVVEDGTVKAEFLYSGSRADYVAEMRRVAARSLPTGLAFLALGIVSTAGFVLQMRSALKEIAAESAAEQALLEAQARTHRHKRRTARKSMS